MVNSTNQSIILKYLCKYVCCKYDRIPHLEYLLDQQNALQQHILKFKFGSEKGQKKENSSELEKHSP